MARRIKGSSAGDRGVRESEVSDDEIDAFHEQRDKILLGQAPLKGKRRSEHDPYDALADANDVLAVDEAVSDEASLDEEDDVDDEEEAGEEYDDEDVYPVSKKVTATKAVAQADSSDDDEADAEAGSDLERDNAVGGWGSNKRAYYNTNDLDNLDSDSEMDEDERRAMELREVKKLQQRSRQGMTDDDFGLGGTIQQIEAESGAVARERRRKELDLDANVSSADNAAQMAIPAPLNPAELIARVQRETPETMALIGEYADMVDEMHTITNRMKTLQDKDPDHQSLGLLHLHHQTLLTYVGTLTFYFYARASPTSSTARRIPMTAVIERLAKLKKGLSALEDFGLGHDDAEGDDDDDEDEDDAEAEEEPVSFLFKPRSMFQDDSSEEEDGQSLGSLEEDELMQLDAEEKENVRVIPQKKEEDVTDVKSQGKGKGKGKDSKKSAAQKSTKAASKKEELAASAPLASLADLMGDDEVQPSDEDFDDTLAPLSKKRKTQQRIAIPSVSVGSNVAFDAYGEPTSLGAVDMADKEATRRSLKFHTGQLDAPSSSKAARKLQGDVDIPYRDKERSRTAVASANANKSAKLTNDPSARRQLDQDDFGEGDAQDWRDVMDEQQATSSKRGGNSFFDGEGAEEGGDDGDYYDLITNARKSAKRAQKEQYDEERQAQRVVPDDALAPGEHRAIDRTIEKNRGLTPRRPKASRNPRVKKRMRYEQAQKRLSSRGPVYKGGQGALQGGYSGESSGISSHVVKSRQFA